MAEEFRPISPARQRRPYDLGEPALQPPDLPGTVVVTETIDELVDRVAADLVVHAENCVRTFGDFHLALCGGRTPLPLYRRLMYDPNYRRLPWRRTHLWIVDERGVPFDDPRSNFREIDETIVDHADIPREQVHPMHAVSDTGVEDYERELRETLSWREKGHDRLDYVLLGVGTDGHTAGLFAGSSALFEQTRPVRLVEYAPIDPPRRVTLTLPFINAARFISVMVTGQEKADAIERLAAGGVSRDQMPIAGVRPLEGTLKWYLDAEACGSPATR